jgi:ubiquitin-conjugating enzyme E2 J1
MSKLAIKQQKRLKGELKILENENNISYITAYQDENDTLLFYFLIYGQYDTDYKRGQYIGKIILSKNYPFSPPDFMFLTPNGRFEINRKICLSITGFHSDEWNPTITISGMLVQLYTVFEKDIDVGLGHIKRSKNERKELANKSIEFNSNKLSHIYSKFNMDNLNDGKPLNIIINEKDNEINKLKQEINIIKSKYIKDDNIKDDNIKDDNIKDDNIKDDNIKDDNIKEEKTKKKRKDKIIDNIEDKIEKKIKKKDKEKNIINDDKIEKKIKKKNKEKNIINDEEKTDEVPKKKRGRPKKIEK